QSSKAAAVTNPADTARRKLRRFILVSRNHFDRWKVQSLRAEPKRRDQLLRRAEWLCCEKAALPGLALDQGQIRLRGRSAMPIVAGVLPTISPSAWSGAGSSAAIE